MRSLYLLLIVALGGCDLYFNGGDDCVVAYTDIAPALELRNPDNGQCEAWGYGGYPCDSACGPCPAAETQAQPDWGQCFSQCEGLIESSCIQQAGCRAVYNANSAVDAPPEYLDCWAIAPSGPAPGTNCENLDAYECSRHDNCSAYYDENPAADPSLFFSSCRAEKTPGCYGDEECGPNGHCSTSDGECLTPPDCDPNGACPAVCFGRCVNDADICAVALCEAGTHCEAQCTEQGCHPVCVPDQNSCAAVLCAPGFECVETCNAEDPNNPGCGICQPTCVPVGTCESLGTESECAGRSDCRPVYNGEDCTCYANGTCECQVLTYDRCETK